MLSCVALGFIIALLTGVSRVPAFGGTVGGNSFNSGDRAGGGGGSSLSSHNVAVPSPLIGGSSELAL